MVSGDVRVSVQLATGAIFPWHRYRIEAGRGCFIEMYGFSATVEGAHRKAERFRRALERLREREASLQRDLDKWASPDLWEPPDVSGARWWVES